ncbi:MAG: tetratricopeptide repeat protein [Gammaproteobacteria bacterium]|nr:tetratricopeptide repeat protein [Gammaproteobacteria bacterium]
MTLFLVASLLLLLLALAIVLLPLFRSPVLAQHQRLHKAFRDGLLTAEEFAQKFQAIKDQAGHAHARPRRSNSVLAVALLLLMPLAGYWLYQQLGTPDALQWPAGARNNVAAENPGNDIESLQALASAEPDNRSHWMRLASALTRQSRFKESADALQQALALTASDAPERADILASLAENQLFAATGSIPATALNNLQEALQIDADNPRALWLSGAVAFQQADYSAAIGHWQTLLPLVDDAGIRDSIQQQLNQALAALHSEVGADLNATDNSTPAPATDTAATAFAPQINVTIEFDTALQQRLQQHSGPAPVLFLFARRPDSPGPPLAIQRVENPQAPLQLTLSNAQAMVPGNDLGSLGQGAAVELVARLSWSGNASAASGDWQNTENVTLEDSIHSVRLLLAKTID